MEKSLESLSLFRSSHLGRLSTVGGYEPVMLPLGRRRPSVEPIEDLPHEGAGGYEPVTSLVGGLGPYTLNPKPSTPNPKP